MPAMTLRVPTEVCTSNFFLGVNDRWCHSIDCLFVSESQWWTQVSSQLIILDRKASPYFSLLWRSSAQMFLQAVLRSMMSIFSTHLTQTLLWSRSLMMTINANFPISNVVHKSLDVMQRSFRISASTLSMVSLVSVMAGRPLHGLSPVSPLIKQQTQLLTELTSVVSSPYMLKRHLWISIGMEPSVIVIQSPACPVHMSTTSNILHCHCVDRAWLTGAPMPWWSWTVSLSNG